MVIPAGERCPAWCDHGMVRHPIRGLIDCDVCGGTGLRSVAERKEAERTSRMRCVRCGSAHCTLFAVHAPDGDRWYCQPCFIRMGSVPQGAIVSRFDSR